MLLKLFVLIETCCLLIHTTTIQFLFIIHLIKRFKLSLKCCRRVFIRKKNCNVAKSPSIKPVFYDFACRRTNVADSIKIKKTDIIELIKYSTLLQFNIKSVYMLVAMQHVCTEIIRYYTTILFLHGVEFLPSIHLSQDQI